MSSIANIAIHASQFPENVRRDLLESLRAGRVNHKFHYDSVKQAQKWLALHEAWSPARTEASCLAAYEKSFRGAIRHLESPRVHLIGLGCGGGQKDARLIEQLGRRGKETSYTPCDVSTAMVLIARQAALHVLPQEKCLPLVCDLTSTDDLVEVLEKHGPTDAARLVTFFGMIPNFEPQMILPRLAAVVRRSDALLLSANLAPGEDYLAGVRRILPQYDNPLTRDWLLTFLLDLGVERGDGELRFAVEDDTAGSGLKRVVAVFHFAKSRVIEIGNERIEFGEGRAIQLFFSYRYTPERVRQLLSRHGLEVHEEWLSESQEEGVFLCRRAT